MPPITRAKGWPCGLRARTLRSAPFWLAASALGASGLQAAPPEGAGPYNARFLEGGIGLERALPADNALVQAGSIQTAARPAKSR